MPCGLSPNFKTFRSPRVDSEEPMHSASACSLAGRYNNPIPTRFPAPKDCLKIPALTCSLQVEVGHGGGILRWYTQLELSLLIPCIHGLINYIDTKAKCSHLKNLHLKGLWVRCLSVWGPEPHTLPPYTLYTCIQYTYSHREGGRGGRVEPQRRGDNSDKHLPQSPFTA